MLVEHELTRKLFDKIGIMLCERGLMMKEGTIVDATIVEAPPSTKNKQKSHRCHAPAFGKGERGAIAYRSAASTTRRFLKQRCFSRSIAY